MGKFTILEGFIPLKPIFGNIKCIIMIIYIENVKYSINLTIQLGNSMNMKFNFNDFNEAKFKQIFSEFYFNLRS